MGKVEEIRIQVEAAAASLEAARGLLSGGQYDAAASRAAEAALHASRALLLDEEIEAGQHGDVLALIQQVFVAGRRLTLEQGEKLHWLFQFRQRGDPAVGRPLIHGEAQKAVEFAESFLQAARVILEA